MDKISFKVISFVINGVAHGLPLNSVVRVNLAVEVTPLPETTEQLLGVINFQGKILPVINLRSLFRMPSKEVTPTDLMIIFQTSGHELMVFVVDEILGVIDVFEEELKENIAIQTPEYSLVARQNGTMFIHHPDIIQQVTVKKNE